MKKKEIITTVIEYNSELELSNIEQELVEQSKDSAKNAYAPYSNFNVGATILLANGEIVSANNQENAAYPSGMCAERVAMFYANAKYPNIAVQTIVISAFSNNKLVENPITPCGSCRQVLLETEYRFKNNIKVIMVGEKILSVDSINELLPLSFSSKNL